MPSQKLIKKNPINICSQYYLKQFEFEDQLNKGLNGAGFNEITDVQSRLCIFDLSQSFWHDLGTLLWLIALLHKLKKQGNDLQLIFPEPVDSKSRKIWDFLIRWRFFETLSLCVDDPINLLESHQLRHIKSKSQYGYSIGKDESGEDTILFSSRILEMSTILQGKEEDEENLLEPYMNRLTDKIIITALSRRCGWEKDDTVKFVKGVCGEGLRNSILHAMGSYSIVAMRMDNKYLTLTISDNGNGIPETLREAFSTHKIKEELIDESDVTLIKYFTEPDMIIDSQLIKLSVKKGITSKAEQRQGHGLYYLKSLVLDQGGQLRIRSGKACVDFKNEKESDDHDDMINSPGTMMRILIPVLKQHHG